MLYAYEGAYDGFLLEFSGTILRYSVLKYLIMQHYYFLSKVLC